MARTTLEHQEDRLTFPPDSILELKIDEAEVVEQNRRDGSGSWERLRVKFKILGVQAVGDGSNPSLYQNWITEYIYGSVSFYLSDSPNNKLRQWCEAIFRQELAVGFELDTNMLVGRSVRGITSQYQKANDNLPRHQVESLLSWGGQPNGVPQQQPQQWSTPAMDPWAPPPQQPQYAQQQYQQYQQPPQQQPPPQQAPPQAPPQPVPAQDPWGTWPKDDDPPF